MRGRVLTDFKDQHQLVFNFCVDGNELARHADHCISPALKGSCRAVTGTL